MSRSLPLCCLALLLCACGQRGDLFLPGAEREVVGSATPDQQVAPGPGAQADDDEEPAGPAASPIGPANAGAGQ